MSEFDASLAERVAGIDWINVCGDLDAHGNAVIPQLLTAGQCRALIAMYERAALFRRRVVMGQHGYGQGEYQYFAYPLPEPIAGLRSALYPQLAGVANRWHAAMEDPVRFPERHADFIQRCHAAGQSRPTPLLLRYDAEDYNHLHQDLYGQHVFPLQITILLSSPQTDFSGGEFVLTEQRPRMQPRVEVVPLALGDAVVFAVNQRPLQGTRGISRVNLKHGVSRVRSGRRYTAGIIFHDAT